MTLDTNKKLSEAINTLSKDIDIIAIVKAIEGGIKTTKDNYGAYMQVLSPYSKDVTSLYIISEALKLAGGNVNGIQWACKILLGA